jgi:MoxR-like ATPase
MSTEVQPIEEVKVTELRKAARHFAPETRGVGGLAHAGTREQLIQLLLQDKGVMASEIQEFLAGGDVQAPQDTPEPYWHGFDAGAGAGEGEEPEQQPEQKQEQPQEKEASKGENDELEIIRKIINKGKGVDEEAVKKIVREELKKKVKVIEVKRQDLPPKEIGMCHHLTEQIAKVCNLGINQMLVGPAGGGKTTTGEKVAEILDIPFYPMSVGPQTTKSDLLGFIDAHGNYHATPLRNAFENGGLLLLDEMDAANAGVLTIINALLANGYCSFPDGIKKRHDDFRCICACNTFGRGADRQYVGRNQLDAATLDRFAVVDFDYDEDLERQLAGHDEWVSKIQRYRKRVFQTKQRVVISPRASIYGAQLLASGMKEKDVEELVVWKGVSAEIRSKIQG